MLSVISLIIPLLFFSFFSPKIIDTKYSNIHTSNVTDVLDQKIDNAEEKLREQYPNIDFRFGDEVNNWYKFLVYKGLEIIPDKHVKNLRFLEIETTNMRSRGAVSFVLSIKNIADVNLLINSSQFPLETGFTCEDVKGCLRNTEDRINKQFVGVLIHEMGHIVDLGESTKGDPKTGENPDFRDGSFSFFNDDITAKYFYPICFADEKTINSFTTRDDFVSGYARTDVFEDFAETLAVYILDGLNFKEKSEFYSTLERKPVLGLKKKYEFMKAYIFDGREFIHENDIYRNSFSTYDTTKRDFNIEKFLTL